PTASARRRASSCPFRPMLEPKPSMAREAVIRSSAIAPPNYRQSGRPDSLGAKTGAAGSGHSGRLRAPNRARPEACRDLHLVAEPSYIGDDLPGELVGAANAPLLRK